MKIGRVSMHINRSLKGFRRQAVSEDLRESEGTLIGESEIPLMEWWTV